MDFHPLSHGGRRNVRFDAYTEAVIEELLRGEVEEDNSLSESAFAQRVSEIVGFHIAKTRVQNVFKV